MQFKISLALVALSGAAINATPIDIVGDVECLVVTVVIQVLAALTSETAFCSSYLNIPTITSTTTATSTIFTTTTRTTTTGTDTSTARAVTVTDTVSETTTTCALNAIDKRQLSAISPSSRSASTTRSASQVSVQASVQASAQVSIPAAVAIFGSAQVSLACSCLNIPTPSTTITQTRTVTPTVTRLASTAILVTTTPTTTIAVTSTSTEIVCPTPTSCDNQGLLWAEYHSDAGENRDPTFSSFIPEIYKSRTPGVWGITSTIGGISVPGGTELSVYGSSRTFYSDFFALNHKGYLFAVLSGIYTFNASRVDDIFFLWLGPKAYSGWTRANADLVVPIYNPGSGSTSIDLVEGQYLPLRIMFGQGAYPAEFQISVTAPDGTVFLTSDTENSPYIVQYSCDGVTAPPFASWGSEYDLPDVNDK
ncbi:hypothetical protein PFICI_00170 [Pestalotiopsis fici W106-1]|uniref:PA14 domain-containing protein n=1 Tax=Pestalotiopsis fici (strain W106-1 / CGMCC3.15140) TaxID=1229662 RepID=W3XLK6_PESFW|nr:uncharacterized protein PFICI_00170 [Pestalotiopsis fici W106-1]ETS86342.1 hypothetical protein PFICI_00170 [Pestalotiopsis fici W106-1]